MTHVDDSRLPEKRYRAARKKRGANLFAEGIWSQQKPGESQKRGEKISSIRAAKKIQSPCDGRKAGKPKGKKIKRIREASLNESNHAYQRASIEGKKKAAGGNGR